MNKTRIVHALTELVGNVLAEELAVDFVKIRQDYATKTLERASCGKFVETVVQCLQQITKGAYDAKPNVDDYLGKRAEAESALPEGLRICAVRIARSIYTLRNKRNIAHKNPIDPNTFDLAYIHQGAAWITAEMIRQATGVSMQEAGELIELIQAPVGTLVEEIGGTRLVHANVSAESEILILLHSHYPEYVPVANMYKSMEARGQSTIRNCLGAMKTKKLIFGDGKKAGYRLTVAGYSAAVAEIGKIKT